VGPTKSGDEAARCCRRSRMWAQCAARRNLSWFPVVDHTNIIKDACDKNFIEI